jgi:soluble lytic murein transglycosylase-like protein
MILLGFGAAAMTAARDWRPDPALAAQIATDSGAAVTSPRVMIFGVTAPKWFTGDDLKRWNRVFKYAKRYDIPADLAAAIYDEAVAARIDPELAYRVVKLESRFDESAKSPVGAMGLTQLMLKTARIYEPGITPEQVHDRHTNLRIGFTYLRDLIKQYKSVSTALLVYNRGAAAVLIEREMGIDPSNGYDAIVLKGYLGKGIID